MFYFPGYSINWLYAQLIGNESQLEINMTIICGQEL